MAEYEIVSSPFGLGYLIKVTPEPDGRHHYRYPPGGDLQPSRAVPPAVWLDPDEVERIIERLKADLGGESAAAAPAPPQEL